MRAIVISTALALAAFAGCGSAADRAEEHMQRAAAYRADGKSNEALIELKRALQETPRDAEVSHRLAELLRSRKEMADAAFFYSEAYRLDPGRSSDALALVDLMRFADPEGAAEIIDEVLAREPDHSLAHVRRAQVALVQNDARTALTSAAQAVRLDPGAALAHFQLGIAYQAQIRQARLDKTEPDGALFAAALEAFETARRLAEVDPVRIRAGLEHARTLSGWPGHQEEAGAAWRALVEGAARSEQKGFRRLAARGASEFARRRGDTELLRWALRHQVASDPGVSAWRSLARLEDANGGSGEATLRTLVAGRPQQTLAHVTFARYLADRGRGDEAIRHLRDAADAGVPRARLLVTEAQLLYERGDGDAAGAAVEELVRSFPGTPGAELAMAHRELFLDRPGDAAERLRRALERKETWEGRYLLAVAELRLRRLEAATQSCDRARELAPTWVRPLEELDARIHLESRRFTDAILGLRRLRQLGGPLGETQRVMLARGLYGQNRPASARRVLEPMLASPRPPAAAVLTWAQHERAREPDRSHALLQDLLEREPQQRRALRYLTELDLAADRRAQALARLDAVPDASQDDFVRLLRAGVLQASDDPARAEAELTTLTERSPPYPPAVTQLVGLYTSQGRVDEAIASMERSATRAALTTPHRVLLARLQMERGRLDEARALLEAALAERSDLPGAKNDLAYVLAVQGVELDRALQLAQEAYQALDDEAATADTLGFVYLRKGLHDAAARQFDLAVELANDAGAPHPLLYYHHGLALAALTEHARAARAFETALRLDPAFPEAEAARRALALARLRSRAAASGPS
jgi:tetratricopeptide (TPR) repeat protein